MSAPAGTQALDRAAGLVAAVVRADAPLSFAELQDEFDLPKSTASRLLAALERTELVERTGDGSYVAGPLFWLYATRHDPWEELVRLAYPSLERVGQETGEAVNLAVARGDRVVQVAQVDSTYLLGTRDWTQVSVPAHASALGKVLLAYGVLPTPAEFEQLTDLTIRSRTALADQCRAIVRLGWATTVDELEEGLSGVAVPVRGAEGAVIGSLGVSGPTARLDGRLAELGELLAAEADRLSATLRRKTREEGAA